MNDWLPCPYAADYHFDAELVRAQWSRLHALDAEPLPGDQAVLRAWALFHSGQFEAAEAAGLQAGWAGMAVANRATAAYATLLEPHEKPRLDLYQRILDRARAAVDQHPDDASAWYGLGYALTRCAQSVHIARALAQGIGNQIRVAFETTLKLAPGHAFAHAALGSFDVEVIDKVGPLVATMAYNARADAALTHLRQAQRLAPDSAAVLLDFAAALLMLDSQANLAEATRLQEQAAQIQARDAAERLWVELARTNLSL
jgi:tetratricopeptide (TPR) repeat protein